jgi:hypothetical protein
MKKLLMVLLVIVSMAQATTDWNEANLLKQGYILTLECNKAGFLIEVVSKNNTKIEQLHCYDRGFWNNSACTHPPIKCNKNKE